MPLLQKMPNILEKELFSTVENYTPYNDAEIAYKESFLQFLSNFESEMWSIRDNLVGHLSASAWVVNKDRTKVLFAYHNIYDSWAWLGGHADGDLDLLNVAVKEAKEEAGINNVLVLQEEPISLEALFVQPHIKRGKFIPDHIHFNLTYLLEADENEAIAYRPDESSDVAWIKIDELMDKVTDGMGIKNTYQKIIDKVKDLKI